MLPDGSLFCGILRDRCGAHSLVCFDLHTGQLGTERGFFATFDWSVTPLADCTDINRTAAGEAVKAFMADAMPVLPADVEDADDETDATTAGTPRKAAKTPRRMALRKACFMCSFWEIANLSMVIAPSPHPVPRPRSAGNAYAPQIEESTAACPSCSTAGGRGDKRGGGRGGGARRNQGGAARAGMRLLDVEF